MDGNLIQFLSTSALLVPNAQRGPALGRPPLVDSGLAERQARSGPGVVGTYGERLGSGAVGCRTAAVVLPVPGSDTLVVRTRAGLDDADLVRARRGGPP